MRTFVRLNRILLKHKVIARKLKELESKIGKHDVAIRSIFETIRRLMERPSENPRRRIIGFGKE